MSSEVQRGVSLKQQQKPYYYELAVEKRKFRHFLDYFCSRVLINGFLEIYSQKPTILVADVILDTTMKMMIPIYLKKADTETNMKIFCFHEI